jgi:hypothetical protein
MSNQVVNQIVDIPNSAVKSGDTSEGCLAYSDSHGYGILVLHGVPLGKVRSAKSPGGLLSLAEAREIINECNTEENTDFACVVPADTVVKALHLIMRSHL